MGGAGVAGGGWEAAAPPPAPREAVGLVVPALPTRASARHGHALRRGCPAAPALSLGAGSRSRCSEASRAQEQVDLRSREGVWLQLPR